MPSMRLHIDAAAPVVAAQAAASASAALMTSAAAAPGSLGSAGASPTSPFDVLAQTMRAWATGAHHSASTAAHARGATVGALSINGFTALTEMNAGNAADLRAVGQQL
jgi:hypothetical protein